MFRNAEGWIEEYKIRNTRWVHDGNPNRVHACLTSGMHTDVVWNTRLIISDEKILWEAACDLIELFTHEGGEISRVEAVVGPQTGATKLAEFLSDYIADKTRTECLSASPEKRDGEMIFIDDERLFLKNKYILLCEDVITTGGSLEYTVEAIHSLQAAVMPYVLCLVNRSGLSEIDGRYNIVSLINQPGNLWTAKDCPLCKQGSVAIRPKDNWNLLMAK